MAVPVILGIIGVGICAVAQQPEGSLGAANEAARQLDYRKAVEHLDSAVEKTEDEKLKQRIERRRKLYQQYLEYPQLIEAAGDNPGALIGKIVLRDDTAYTGFIELVEFGVPVHARIGNRVPDSGQLLLQNDEQEPRRVRAGEIGAIGVMREGIERKQSDPLPSVKQFIITRHDGSELKLGPSWELPISAMSVLSVEAAEDADPETVEAYPAFTGLFAAGKLVSRIFIIGAPAEEQGGGGGETAADGEAGEGRQPQADEGDTAKAAAGKQPSEQEMKQQPAEEQ